MLLSQLREDNTAVSNIIILIAKELLHNHAVLFSNVYGKFLQAQPQQSEGSAPSKRWLLAQIVTKLSPHIRFFCKIQNLGTVLYQSGGDLLYALSHALGQAKPKPQSLQSTAQTLHQRLTKQASQMTGNYCGNADMLAKMSLDSVTAQIDPDV